MMRIKLIRAMLGDDNLAALLGSSGDIIYLGHQTDQETGYTFQGQMQVNFQLTYLLDPRELGLV